MTREHSQSSSDRIVRNELGQVDSASDNGDLPRTPVSATPKRTRFRQKSDTALDDVGLSVTEESDGSGRINSVLYGVTQGETFVITHDDIADYFLACGNEFGDSITNLRLQKLVYYAQAWYLANYGKPIFSTDFEAWVHGPVIPALYHKYKTNGPRSIFVDLSLDRVEKRFDEDTLGLLQEVAEVYMGYTGYQLELMTHREDPWLKIRGDLPPDSPCNKVIPKDLMRDYYAKKLEEED